MSSTTGHRSPSVQISNSMLRDLVIMVQPQSVSVDWAPKGNNASKIAALSLLFIFCHFVFPCLAQGLVGTSNEATSRSRRPSSVSEHLRIFLISRKYQLVYPSEESKCLKLSRRSALPMRVRRNGLRQAIPKALFSAQHFKPPRFGNLRRCTRVAKVRVS
jgi:hypothetical protein